MMKLALHNSNSANLMMKLLLLLLLLIVFTMGVVTTSGFAAPYEPEWTPPGGGYALTGERLVC